MWYTSGSGRIELQLTKNQALTGAHISDCEADIKYLRQLPAIKKQLAKLEPETLAKELKEYGAWDRNELTDHEQNLTRILWIACCDIAENCHQFN
jgi:hypothetical protein